MIIEGRSETGLDMATIFYKSGGRIYMAGNFQGTAQSAITEIQSL
jgi:hypothetical protein